MDKLTGIPRHDLIASIIRERFNWSNIFGMQTHLISSRESTTDNNYIVLFNETTTQAFVEKQMNKLINLFELFAEPVMNSIERKIEGIPKEDVQQFIELAKNGEFKEV